MNVRIDVLQDHEVELSKIEQYSHIIFSPGPGLPGSTQSMFAVLDHYAQRKPILGVCLGMQGIAEFFGGKLFNQATVKHGVQTICHVTHSDTLFEGLPEKFNVGLYHSWAVERNSSVQLTELAYSDDGVMMALKHKDHPIFGVQFHPESILTEYGNEILRNFLFKS